MSDRHATVNDLPGWNTPDTVLGLNGNPGLYGWIWLQNPGRPTDATQRIGRGMDGRLYAATAGEFAGRVHRPPVEQGYIALLAGVKDGIGLWLPRNAYHHIKLIDPTEPGDQPDVPCWLPIREVLADIPASVPPLPV